MPRKKAEETEDAEMPLLKEFAENESVPTADAEQYTTIEEIPECDNLVSAAGVPPDMLMYGPEPADPSVLPETIEYFAQPEPSTEIPIDKGDEPPAEPVLDAFTELPKSERAAEDFYGQVTETPAAEPKAKPESARKKTIYDLKLNDLDRDLSEDERREWSAIYASYRAKSVLSGTVIGADQNTFDIWNRETGEEEKKTLTSLIVIDYRVKVLIPESEMWMPGEERPEYVLRNMTGTQIDYVIMEVDREGMCAIGSRRMALAAKRHYFATARNGHQEGDLLKCRVMAAGPKSVTVECNGYDIRLSQRDLSYTAIADLREKYHPGQELTCKLKEYDRETVSQKQHHFTGQSIRVVDWMAENLPPEDRAFILADYAATGELGKLIRRIG